MMGARTFMAESGTGARFWFRAATAGKDSSNVTFKELTGMTQHQAMYGEKKDKLQSIWMQSLGIPGQATQRKRKAHAKGKGSSICWIRTKHELGILGPRGQDNESSTIQ